MMNSRGSWRFGILAALVAGCGASSVNTEGSTSEVAASVVSGALNNNSGAKVGFRFLPSRRSAADRIWDALQPVGVAEAATWTCTGGTMSPLFAGPGTYLYSPLSCSVQWATGKTGSSNWSGPFTLAYGSSCNAANSPVWDQGSGCVMTRTTGTGGVTRSITGPLGNTYAITHDTNGQNTGWDMTVSPAATNGGVVLTCGTGGCNTAAALLINGSHLTGTLDGSRIWDHTITTENALTLSTSGATRTVNGVVTVQHNIAQYTAHVTFSDVMYSDTGCCFPTGGSVSATYSVTTTQTKTESLSFGGGSCGEASYTPPGGKAVPLTLEHCL